SIVGHAMRELSEHDMPAYYLKSQKRVDSEGWHGACVPNKIASTTSHQSLGRRTIRRWYSRHFCTDPRRLQFVDCLRIGQRPTSHEKTWSHKRQSQGDTHLKSWLLRTRGPEKARSVN